MRILCSGMSADEREDGAEGVRRLAGHPDRQLVAHPVEAGDAAAGLDRGDVDARDVDVLGDDDLGLVEDAVGRRPGRRPPSARCGSSASRVGPDERRVGLERLERVDDRLQRLVLDLDGERRVGGDVAVGRRRRPRPPARGRRRGRSAAPSGVSLISVGIQARPAASRSLPVMTASTPGIASAAEASMLDDLGVGVRAAHDVEVEHARQLDVVDVVALAAHEARVFLAPDPVADALSRSAPCYVIESQSRSHRLRAGRRRSRAALAAAAAATAHASFAAACWIDRDDVDVAGAAAEVAGDRLADLCLARVGVLVQQRRPPSSSCPGCRSRTAGRAPPRSRPGSGAARRRCSSPSTVAISPPSAWTAKTVQDLTGRPFQLDRAGAATGGVAADVRAGQAERLADEMDQQQARLDLGRAVARR